ncbi:hypothetical protein ABVF61_21145 [Roseibium sp. HPY-6]|uniref:hypothetical protein n=1 Tax=Roseibium sp. HPY-6 TaxID=3229852 RepID=UPI00338EE3A3
MNILMTWLESGWLAVAAMAILWAETLLLCLLSSSPMARFKALAGGALAGTFLLAALAFALRGDALGWVLLFLSLSLFAHLLDVAGRLKDHSAALSRNTDKLSSPAVLTQRR